MILVLSAQFSMHNLLLLAVVKKIDNFGISFILSKVLIQRVGNKITFCLQLLAYTLSFTFYHSTLVGS
jgi:hypothetical protein